MVLVNKTTNSGDQPEVGKSLFDVKLQEERKLLGHVTDSGAGDAGATCSRCLAEDQDGPGLNA